MKISGAVPRLVLKLLPHLNYYVFKATNEMETAIELSSCREVNVPRNILVYYSP